MKKFLAVLLVLTVAPAAAQDVAGDILYQPSMSSLPQPVVHAPQRRSAPVETVVSEPVEEEQVPAPLGYVDKPVDKAPATAAQPVEIKPSFTGVPLKDILATAYTSSPTLRAEREVLRQQYENVAQADSAKRPVVTADGGVAWVHSKTDPGADDSVFARDLGLSVTQYLYRGGRTLAEVEQQLRLSDAALAAYDFITQDTFLNVVTAAMDIQRDRATIELTEKNRSVIERQLQFTKRAFEVGELTRTDVAQSQARLSGAEADLVAAQADYSSALARFKQYAGQDGESMNTRGDFALPVPASLGTAENAAQSEHPQIRVAREAEKAAQSAVAVATGALLPEVYLAGAFDQDWEPSPVIDKLSSAAVGLRASIPLYEGGLVRSQVRQAKYGVFEQRDRIEEAERAVRRFVATAWNDYQAARSRIEARREQVDAAKLARDGVYKEFEVGTRTVLDTLNADAELLNAEVGLVRAERDTVVAGYALLAATGQLTAEKLGFFSREGEKAHLNQARGNWFGTGVQGRE